MFAVSDDIKDIKRQRKLLRNDKYELGVVICGHCPTDQTTEETWTGK